MQTVRNGGEIQYSSRMVETLALVFVILVWYRFAKLGRAREEIGFF